MQRLAVLVGVILLVACGSGFTEPLPWFASSTVRVDSLELRPALDSLKYGDEGLLAATCFNQYDDIVRCSGGVTWTVRDTTKVLPMLTKDTIGHVFPRDTGSTYVVASAGAGRGKDSTRIIVTTGPPAPITPTPPPPDILATIDVAPSPVTLETSVTQQFTAVARNTVGGVMAVTFAWTATGGTIGGGTGLYTAGGTPGTYRVIATSGAVADTAVVTVTAPVPVADLSDTLYMGVNGNTGFNTSSPYVAQVNTHLNAVGAGLVRMGMDGVAGSTTGTGFSFTTRDAVVSAHLAAGVAVHTVLSFRSHVSHGASQAEWIANWRHFVGGVMRHYDGQIQYYIIDNEPELNGFTDAALAVTFVKAAYDSAAVIDADARIETPPTGSAGAAFLQAMINAGITRYAHVVGVHAYGGQLNDDHAQGLRKPWEWMAASGYPQIAVACSECSTSSDWAPAGVDARTWQARWFRASAIAFRRYGYDNVLLYSFRSTAGVGFDIASWNGTSLVANQPTYDAVRNAYGRNLALTNGGFESANDRELEWAIVFNTDQATPVEWSRATFVTGDAAGAHAGSGYLREVTSTGGVKVRRVIAAEPGTEVTVSAWTKITGTGTAALRVQGYDRTNGDAVSSQTVTTAGSWVQRSVTVTPTSPWIVVGLEGSGGATILWDDVTVTP